MRHDVPVKDNLPVSIKLVHIGKLLIPFFQRIFDVPSSCSKVDSIRFHWGDTPSRDCSCIMSRRENAVRKPVLLGLVLQTGGLSALHLPWQKWKIILMLEQISLRIQQCSPDRWWREFRLSLRWFRETPFHWSENISALPSFSLVKEHKLSYCPGEGGPNSARPSPEDAKTVWTCFWAISV